MQVCVKCRKEMKCDKNGVGVRYGEKGEHVYMGDRYMCVTCGATIIVTNDNSFHDEDAKRQLPEDVWMDVPNKGYHESNNSFTFKDW